MKTAELTGAALDWAVAKCEYIGTPPFVIIGDQVVSKFDDFIFRPSFDWAQGGPIIEREKIELVYKEDCIVRPIRDMVWEAWMQYDDRDSNMDAIQGPTPLIAAMRCYVASKLGDDVDIPEELA